MSDLTAPPTDEPSGPHPGIDQLRRALREVENRDIDPLTAPWSCLLYTSDAADE